MAKKNLELKNKIVEAYSDHVLEHEKEPKSVFNFCKNNKIILYKLFRHLKYCNFKECRLCQISKVIISIRACCIKVI